MVVGWNHTTTRNGYMTDLDRFYCYHSYQQVHDHHTTTTSHDLLQCINENGRRDILADVPKQIPTAQQQLEE